VHRHIFDEGCKALILADCGVVATDLHQHTDLAAGMDVGANGAAFSGKQGKSADLQVFAYN